MHSVNWIEILAVITGFIAIYFQIKAKVVYWPISILNVLLYIIIFFQSKLYAEISLQFYYLIMSIYGWIFWAKHHNNYDQVAISRSSKKLLLTLLLLIFPVWLSMSWILKNYTDTDVPFIDSFITTMSYIATYLLARKKIENWLLWIFIDFFSIGLYYYKGLYLTIILFVALTILAIVGYFQWKKQLYAAS